MHAMLCYCWFYMQAFVVSYYGDFFWLVAHATDSLSLYPHLVGNVNLLLFICTFYKNAIQTSLNSSLNPQTQRFNGGKRSKRTVDTFDRPSRRDGLHSNTPPP